MTAADNGTAEWTFMFTDIEGSTARGVKTTPAEYRRVVEEHKTRLRACFNAHNGSIDQNPGDGFLVAFRTPSDALRCAVAIQEELRAEGSAPIQTESGGETWTIQVRIGVYRAAGEVMRNADGTWTDTEVSLASRFTGCAGGGQIVVNEGAYQAVRRHSLFENWQEWPNRFIRDFDGPQMVWELLWDDVSRPLKAPEWAPAWLLRETNEFVGRLEILDTIKAWLKGDRPLLVLHGEGGVGKTRLVSHSVREYGGVFEGRIYGVALDRAFSGEPAQVTAGQLAIRIGEMLNAPQEVLNSENGDALIAYMAKEFGSQSCWLVLDNFESVHNATTLEFLGELLYGVRGLRCVVTGREQVDLIGDTVAIPVEGMVVPPTGETHLEHYEANALFQTRARQVNPNVNLSDTTSLAQILRATEGNALAIELIAAHCKNLRLTLRDIADGLEASRLQWLRPTQGSLRYGPARHKNLEACIDWSFQRLPAEEQERYPRLSVFPADFDAEAALPTAEISTGMIDHWILFHLVQVEDASKRCYLQPVLREFAGERVDAVNRDADRLRFAMYYGDLADANASLNHAAQRAILRAELRNLHEAAIYLCAPGTVTAATAPYLNNLGNRLGEIPIGARSENLQRAIECFEAALRVYKEADFPSDWATTQNNLGIAYRDLPAGDRAANVQRAIECYEAALRVYKEADFPSEWAMTQNNLGIAYRDLPGGDRAANVQRAIECYKAALRVYKEADFPSEWATTQNNLGNAYRNLPGGDRAANVQRAIVCYKAALRVYKEADFPSDWAMTQNNLGIAYRNLPGGDRAANVQRAIECYEAALRVRTEADFPSDWAGTQNNLGAAYSDLPAGDRAVNVQRAIECYEAALRVRTEADFPSDWAGTQNNLGAAYSDLPAGDRAVNVQRAIECFEAALRVYKEADFPSDWAGTQNNLGAAYSDLPAGDRAVNVQRAIECYEAALRVRTEADFPSDWAGTQNNLGAAYSNLPAGDRAVNVQRAIACFEAALRVRTEADFPIEYGHSQVCLGNAYADLDETARAREHFRLAVQGYAAAGLPPEWEWRAYAERRLREL